MRESERDREGVWERVTDSFTIPMYPKKRTIALPNTVNENTIFEIYISTIKSLLKQNPHTSNGLSVRGGKQKVTNCVFYIYIYSIYILGFIFSQLKVAIVQLQHSWARWVNV